MMKKPYLHDTIKEQLIRRIEGGIYPSGASFPGTKELAKEFSTSSVTIDKALSSLVEMGYISRKARRGSVVNPREYWQGNSTGRRNGPVLYSLIMRDSPSPYFWKNTIRGIYDMVHTHDAEIISCYIDENIEAARVAVADLKRKGVEGVIYAPVSMPTKEEYYTYNRKLLGELRELKLPFILIDRYLKNEKASYVISEDYEAAVKITEALFALGVKKPICITHLFTTAFEDRVNGFMDTLRAHRFSQEEAQERVIDIAPGKILLDANDTVGVSRVLNRAPFFDGVLSVNAINLYALINTLHRKKHIPSTIESVTRLKFVNFDDIGLLNIRGLVISAVQESHRIGELAAYILLELLPRWPDAEFHVVKDYGYKKYL